MQVRQDVLQTSCCIVRNQLSLAVWSVADDPLAETIGTIRRSSRLQFIVASGLGFFMYKVALIGVSVIGDDGENPE